MGITTQLEGGVSTNDASFRQLVVIGGYGMEQFGCSAVQDIHPFGYAVKPSALHVGMLPLGIQPLSCEPVAKHEARIWIGLHYFLYFVAIFSDITNLTIIFMQNYTFILIDQMSRQESTEFFLILCAVFAFFANMRCKTSKDTL